MTVDLGEVVAGGDYRASLEAVRDRLAAAIDGASDRQLVHVAPLAKQLQDVLKTLADLPVPDAEADSVETAQSDLEAKLRLVQ
ncbi:MAG: hypothetical protein ACXVXO_12530 [Mycobacteriaceae bacterium]